MTNRLDTHQVFNQSPPFADINLYTSDAPLRHAVAREGGAAGKAADDRLAAFGAVLGSAETLEQSRLANTVTPVLRSFDMKGHRSDVAEFHPAYHHFMALSMEQGLHCSLWDHLADGSKPAAGAHVTRAAGIYMIAEAEPGHGCPITMTNASVAALRANGELAGAWLPRILSRRYDPSFRPMADKTAVTIGMGMTEKQGGTDVRSNASTARPVSGDEYILTGHKWFMSAPMCDAFLMLAQAPGGLSCFLVPRFLPDGGINDLRFQRLKEKMGNRSNASTEVEFGAAHGWLVGEEGRGVATIISMVTLTRLDCAVASAGLLHWGLANTLHHTRHRTVFQKKLSDQPLMRAVLADMALDAEAAVALSFRLARAFDRAEDDEAEAAFARVMTPVAKYWCCKLVPQFAYEAMESMGGNGYVEEGPMARLYREAPLNAIWEGSGNVMGLDLLRVVERDGEAFRAVMAGIGDMGRDVPGVAAALERACAVLNDPARAEAGARFAIEQIALAAGAGLLGAHAPAPVADLFSAARLNGRFSHNYGSFGGARPDGLGAILERVLPG